MKLQTTCFKCFAIYGKAFKDPAADIHEASQKPPATQRSTAVQRHRLRGNPVNDPVSEDATYIPQKLPFRVFQDIDEHIKAFKDGPWKAVLPFQGFVCYTGDNIPDAGDDHYNNAVDLFHYVRDMSLNGLATIRLDPSVYNVSGGWDNKSDGQKLITALGTASRRRRGGVN